MGSPEGPLSGVDKCSPGSLAVVAADRAVVVGLRTEAAAAGTVAEQRTADTAADKSLRPRCI